MKKFFLLSLLATLSLVASAAITIENTAGWLESAAVEFKLGADSMAHVYVAPEGGAYTQLDAELVRVYPNDIVRADALGLKAGNYTFKIVPVRDEVETPADAVISSAVEVKAHDHGGFAHFNWTKGVGAYKDDGTLKDNAVVLYVTKDSAKKVKMDVTGAEQSPCVGLQQIITGYQKGKETRPLCVRLIGMIKAEDMDGFDSSSEGLQIKGRAADSELNITIEGVGNDAFVYGWGFLIRNCKSVELRNFAVRTLMDDDISLDTDNSNIWVHHIDGFYGRNKGGDQKKGDGCIDVKGNSKYVTVAYCHFWDTGKSTMCGMHQDDGDNFITYHHNWFDHSDSRHARIRTMSVHMYNNYYDGIAKYGVGATSASSVFMEANYFKNCPKPMLISLQGTDVHMGVGSGDDTKGTFSGEEGGIIKSYGNYYSGSKTLVTYQQNQVHFDCWEASSRTATIPAEVVTLSGNNKYNNFDTDASKMYTYNVDNAEAVPGIVMGNYGAGRMYHGDFAFTFTSADDSSYEINAALESALNNYKPSVIGILGAKASQPDPDPDPDPDPTKGAFECHFDGGKPSSTFYTISGTYSNSKGTAEVNGTTYTWCLKMESATSIKFKLEQENTIYLRFGDSDTKVNIKVDGTKVVANGSDKYIQYDLTAGEHELTKADGCNLFYINMLKSTDITETTVTTPARKIIRDGQLMIIRDGVSYDMMGRIIR